MRLLSTLALTATSAFAFPIALPNRILARHDPYTYIIPHGMSCYASDMMKWVDYDVHVGEPFDNGSGCDHIKDLIAQAVKLHDDEYTCNSDKHGGTVIHFELDSQGHGAAINAALDLAYAGTGTYGFNCPDY